MAKRVAREGSSFCLSRSSLFSPPERCKRHLYEHSLSQSVAPQSNPSPKHFWPRLRCASLRLKTAAVFGPIDCALRLALRFTPTPLLRHGVGRYGLRLWLQTISVNRPTPPLAFPARRGRCAALVPTVGARRRFPRSSHPQRTDERTVISLRHSLHYSP